MPRERVNLKYYTMKCGKCGTGMKPWVIDPTTKEQIWLCVNVKCQSTEREKNAKNKG